VLGKKSLKIQKGQSESINRRTDNIMAKGKRTDNIMAKGKRTNNDLQNTIHKSKDGETRASLWVVNSGG
jgi:hypothetical protein